MNKIVFTHSKLSSDSVMKHVPQNILIKFNTPIKQISTTKTCLNKNYTTVHIAKYMSLTLSVHSGLKQDGLSPPLFNFTTIQFIRQFPTVYQTVLSAHILVRVMLCH
jgi:hypothetical protein